MVSLNHDVVEELEAEIERLRYIIDKLLDPMEREWAMSRRDILVYVAMIDEDILREVGDGLLSNVR